MKFLIPLPIFLLSAIAAELHVGGDHTHKTLSAAIAAAADGDTIIVHPGIYQESGLKVEKSLKLTGSDWPVIDGRKSGEVFTITAPNVEIRGFEIRNSGKSGLEDLAGIKVSETRNATVASNRLRDCNFGIYLSKTNDCRVSDNDVRGTPGGEQESGNGIHLWSCENITVTGNHVRDHRDGIYLEFAKQSVIERNTVRDNLRYGLHYMFSHDSAYRHNRFERNGAGVAVMYTRNVEMSSNHFVNNWGSSAYGLMLKDMTDGRITGNTFERNSIAIALHGSNRMEIENNRFSENGWAIQVQRSSSDNTYRKNNFVGNSFDIAADGELDNNNFESNYWDKYEGYDLRRDGIGDVPFRPVSLYAVVVGRIPSSVLLLRSPVVHLLDQAEKAFPSIIPERVVDEKPAMRPNPISRHPHNHPDPKTMKSKSIIRLLLGTAAALVLGQCNKPSPDVVEPSDDGAPLAGQSAVADDVSQKDIVKVAVGSPAHTTLVAAVKAAELVDVLSNAGPFTVFAPTNEGFDKLPKGTVEDLLKPENKDKLADILQYHVLVGGYREEMLTDGKTLGTASGGSVKISVKDGKVVINDSATIIGTVEASNGLVHVVDAVLLPQ